MTDFKQEKTLSESDTLDFIFEVTRLLSSSLDYETTLTQVANMAVPQLADWCAVDLLEEDGQLHRLAVAHIDPYKVSLARQLYERYPPDLDAARGVPAVLRTGRTEYYPQIPLEMLASAARDQEHWTLIRNLGLHSAIVAPLLVQGRALGTITVVWAESNRAYSPDDVILIEQLARNAALAIENARLFKQAQEANTRLEQRVNQRTRQLQATIDALRSEIKERHNVEGVLRNRETMLDNLFSSAPDATVLINENGIIVRVNDRACELFGYDEEEMTGQPIELLIPSRYHHRHEDHVTHYFQRPRLRPMGVCLNLYASCKDGSEFPVDVMLSPLTEGDGALTICAIRDITRQVELQAEVEELHRHFIASTEAERLYLAQELHDGPLQDLYAVYYQLKSFSEGEAIPAGQINQAAELLRSSMENLRALSGELRPPTLAPMGLEKAIHAHASRLQETNPEIRVELDLQPDNQTFDERTRLALFRIYQHAVSNVIRHAEASWLAVALHFDDRQIRLQVKDNGCGFSPPKKLLELGQKGHFGLLGSSERARAIGGELQFTSTPGEGTQITVTVPRMQEVGRNNHHG